MIELRATAHEDLPALSALFAAGFGHPLAPEEWAWKYRQLPGEGHSAVAVDEGGRVQAHAGVIGLPARFEGGQGLLWQLTDFVGDPRGTGLRPPLVALSRWLLGGLPRPGDAPWNYGFPSSRHMRLGEHLLGYGPLRTFRERVGETAAAAGPLPADLDLRVDDHWSDPPAADDPGSGDGAETLWRASVAHGIRRDAAFLNWRYHARPGRYYRFYRISMGVRSGGPGIEGLAVFAFLGTEARAAELWLPPAAGPEGGLERALPAIAADLLASGINRWSFWPPPGTGGGNPFRGLGLEPGAEVFLGFRTGHRRAPEPPAPAVDFYYAMGDWDAT